jgi:hypothetical protein
MFPLTFLSTVLISIKTCPAQGKLFFKAQYNVLQIPDTSGVILINNVYFWVVGLVQA